VKIVIGEVQSFRNHESLTTDFAINCGIENSRVGFQVRLSGESSDIPLLLRAIEQINQYDLLAESVRQMFLEERAVGLQNTKALDAKALVRKSVGLSW